MLCPRSITFTIPGKPGVLVRAEEDAGNIVFTVDVLDSATLTGDLRALFFHMDEKFLAGLTVSGGGGAITESQVRANSVIDLGNGANMLGQAKPFDIGVEFGTEGIGKGDDLSGPITFTLDAAQDLTLDSIAHDEFGARVNSIGRPGRNRNDSEKITFVAPAAPDANPDSGKTHEDVPVQIAVLANDTDADLDQLTVHEVSDPLHGTATISADGKTVIFTPDEDWSGTDTFEYCVSDGNGGEDSAVVTVTVIPVADPPDIVVEVLEPEPNDGVDIIRLKIIATQSDADGSEFIDRIELTGIPAGVVLGTDGNLNPAGQPDQHVEFITLQVPTTGDFKFDLGVTAYSQEEGDGDPDEASATVTKTIEVDTNSTSQKLTFGTQGQSIWGTGSGAPVDYEKFIGINEHFTPDETFVVPLILFGIPFPPAVDVEVEADVTLKFGLNAKVHLQAGDINATLPITVTMNTIYNKTSDSLQFVPSFALDQGAFFNTTGPEGSFSLDMITKFLFSASISSSLDLTGLTDLNFTLPSFNETQPLFTFNSADASFTFPKPPAPPIAGVSIDVAWPHISSQSSQVSGSEVTSHGFSNNFLQLNLDVDELAATLFPLLRGVFDASPGDPDNFEWLDIDINGGLNILQDFKLLVEKLVGTLRFENNTTQTFDMMNGLLLRHASALDSDRDGLVEFALGLTPDVSLDNSTQLGFNVGGTIALLKNVPFVDDTLFEAGDKVDLGGLEIFGDKFAVQGFNTQDFLFAA